MKSESSLCPKGDLEERLALLQRADQGQFDALVCPRCGKGTVSVWFTRRAENDYWTWFRCDNGDFEMRVQGSRPAHYSPARELAAASKPGSVDT